MNVDTTYPFNIWEYSILGLGYHCPEDNDPDMQMLVHAVTEIDLDEFFL